MEVNELFYEIRKAKEKLIILQGGAQAGKTFEALHNIFIWSIENKNFVSTVVAESVPNLKKGALRDADRIINNNPDIAAYITDRNKTDRTITFKSGSVIEFTSYEDEQSAKGGKRHILFCNEVDAIPYEIYWQLSIRTSFKIILDYNPSATFWVHEKLIGKPNTKLFITDHRHNSFLSKEQHDEIENISDPELWKVYARGLTGQLKAAIYTNWINVKLQDWPKDSEFREIIWGIDYGYGTSESAGKTALIKVGITNDRKLYIRECCYHPGGMNEYQIKEVLEKSGWVNGQELYSEHDPTIVSQLRRLGIHIRLAIKGERSEWYGIMKIKKFQVYYTGSDDNLQYELVHYRWVTVGEIVTNTVLETRKWHLMAALRYAIFTHFFDQ